MGLIYKRSYDKYTTMWEVYDKCTIKCDLQKVIQQSYRRSYDKMYDSSLAVIRQHLARMQ